MRFKHVNIIAADWRRLAAFYQVVFQCVSVPPERDIEGEWLERGTGVQDASLVGVHLRLPGCGENGPTLEIYQYARNEMRASTAANREGLTHLAFEVDDVGAALRQVLLHGGRMVGQIAQSELVDVGFLTFVYCADPEGNIIELQNWQSL